MTVVHVHYSCKKGKNTLSFRPSPLPNWHDFDLAQIAFQSHSAVGMTGFAGTSLPEINLNMGAPSVLHGCYIHTIPASTLTQCILRETLFSSQKLQNKSRFHHLLCSLVTLPSIHMSSNKVKNKFWTINSGLLCAAVNFLTGL